jgi:putative DNA primase/helicase
MTKKKVVRKTVRKPAKKATRPARIRDRYDLKFHTDVNGEVGKTTVTVLDREPDSKGQVNQEAYADKLHLDADRERIALAGRIAKAVGQGSKDAWKKYIDLKWFASLKQAATFQKLAAAGSPEAAPGARVEADGVSVTVVPDARGSPRGSPGRVPGLRGENPTDVGNGRRLARWYGDDLRHVFAWKKWLVWDEKRWCPDDTGEVYRRAKAVARQVAEEDPDWAMKSEEIKRINAMIDLARSEPGIPARHTELDVDPFLLNCVNGTLDLRTGELREHRRSDMLTKLCPWAFDPDAECDLWVDTLTRIFDSKMDLVNYLQRLCGYCLTGDTREQMLPIFWGGGSNGKSLVLETVRAVIGLDYAGVAAREVITGNPQAHTTYLADLFGKRLMTLAETAEDGKINETLIKALTGGDRVKGRKMRQDNFEFDATHKIWLATNHKPKVKGNSHAIWRRLRLIPHLVQFWDPDKGETGPPELKADKTLKERLRAEASGVLTWMVRGTLEWLSDGLREPEEVLEATRQYRCEEDVLARFIAERCRLGEKLTCKASVFYEAYKAWHKFAEADQPMSLRRFGEEVRKRDGIKAKDSNGVWYTGIDLAPPEDPQASRENPWA